MKKFLVGLLLLGTSLFCSAEIVTVPIPGAPGLSVTVGTGVNALPLQDIRNNPNAVNITTGDDSWTHVPLGFDFPFYGRTFNNSWAMTNGVVTFQDPVASGAYGLCCQGVNLTTTTDPRYNYSIYGVHSDLYSWNGQNQYYLREGNSMTYGWYNLSQCCNSSGGNSFEIKINSAGLVDTRIAGAMVSWNAVTSGMAGDLSKGEYYQYYHGQGLNISAGGASIFSWQALGGTGADMCTSNPLISTSCPGYQAAYLTQQCTVSALYNPSCPGYQAAYFSQQCSSNPLYNTECPGYASAYLTYQCSVNPLYSTTCEGYQRAYHDQQCSLSPLYATDCNGYQQAYHDQQCSLNPLYMSDCYGYAAAYKAQQCSLNALYATDCPGYQQAYFNQQCSLNGLYSQQCPNYSTAYATKMLLEQQNMASTVATAGVIAQNAPSTTTATVSSEGTVSSTPSATGSTTVDKAIAPTTTTANSAAAPAAPVQLVAPPPAPAAPQQQQAQQEKKPEPKQEGGADKPAGGPTQMAQTEQSGGNKEQPKTARQEMQEKRQAAAKAEAVEKGKNLANEMGKAADMESQKQVQNVVIQAMGFTPGFDVYGKAVVPDTKFYKPYTIYGGQKNIDNRANLRMWTGNDRLHNDMVDSQYNRGN